MISRSLIRALIADPLTATTRSKRRALLTASIVGLAAVKGGLLPEKLPFLGLESISVPEQRVLLLLTWMVVIYYLVAFVLYIVRDVLALIAAYHGDVDDVFVYPQATANEPQLRAIQHRMGYWEAKKGLRRIAWCFAVPRWFLDAVFPLALGCFAAVVLWP